LKNFKWLLVVLGICSLTLSFGCGKKLVRSEVTPSTPLKETARAPESRGEEKPALKEEALTSDKAADLERERKLREESLREQELREKALREEQARKEAAAREAALKSLKLEPVYYDYNQWIIRDDQKEILTKNAEWLKVHPQAKVRIEGNCDERGTAEYNLALGQKRADAAKAFLAGLGIAESRMQTISYGYERPLDKGHNEAAWAKNRRTDFVPLR